MNTLNSLNDLVGQIVVVLTSAIPYLKSITDQVVGQLTKEALQKAIDLYEKVRELFHSPEDDKGTITLKMFVNDPETFESALSILLLHALEKHPELVDNMRDILAEPSVQEIVAHNQSVLERVTQSLSGPGAQRIIADGSTLTDVKQEINR